MDSHSASIIFLTLFMRYLLAYNAEVLGEVTNALAASLLGWLRRCAKQELGLDSVKQVHPGMIVWIQRFGSF